MTLLRRVPRELYRVYDEEEFFASAPEQPFAKAGSEPEVPIGSSQARPASMRRRLACGASLMGVGAFLAAIMFGGVSSKLLRDRARPASSTAQGSARVLTAQVAEHHSRASSTEHAYRQSPAPAPAIRRARSSRPRRPQLGFGAQIIRSAGRSDPRASTLTANAAPATPASPEAITGGERSSVSARALPRPTPAAFAAGSGRGSGTVEFGFERASGGR
jgi:hypothetical protein